MKFLTLLLGALLTVSSTQAIIMNGTELITDAGTISWQELISLRDQIRTLRRVVFGAAALGVGYLAYTKWKKASAKKTLKERAAEMLV